MEVSKFKGVLGFPFRRELIYLLGKAFWRDPCWAGGCQPEPVGEMGGHSRSSSSSGGPRAPTREGVDR